MILIKKKILKINRKISNNIKMINNQKQKIKKMRIKIYYWNRKKMELKLLIQRSQKQQTVDQKTLLDQMEKKKIGELNND